ncbi:IclR family transcriptional regulator [Candidatus Halobonum tyrrellensis]|uniref:IclR family transcriptional regulator n=1 Tax=Candidatus Halobonum tyrrellensis G22 TaxID=1324957 RepID=V4J1R4_9EURY|nr:IclR family transcriptional regulator [Candidatus Halobonum tyrrellensis]ESP89352.1 IclR family transcriptional regulator [Candidatus Halobonum tyrrellensis G22]
MAAETGSAPVGATQTTIRVIEALRELDAAGVSAVADHIDVPTSTAFDHLRTLEQNEFVRREGDEYVLSSQFLEIGGYCRNNDHLYRTAEPELQKMANETGEHANLMIEEFGRGVFYAKAKGRETFRLDTHIGKRVNLQTTSAGKAILAELPDDRVEEIVDDHGLPGITEHTITDRADLFEELDTVREQGFATDTEERLKGVHCVGAALTDDDGDPIGAVSVSGPKNGMQDERFFDDIPELVLRTANVIEVNMKYQ